MDEQQPRQSQQSFNIENSVFENSQIGGIAGRDLNINYYSTTPQNPEADPPLSREENRQRKVLLNKVKTSWIDGVLDKSLHAQFLIELGLEIRNQHIQNPLENFDKFITDQSKKLPGGTTASSLFEDMGDGRTLLILGEPGAGKTVTLLKLAESLILRAEQNISLPIPVIMNLSSWSKFRRPIDEWLVQELYEIYNISKSLGADWIKGEKMLLLLDGLDEVDSQYRNECVKSINCFIQEHGFTEIVICSRIQDYERLDDRLKLQNAIYVKPLTRQQIDHFLKKS
ncbi:MAG: NACHT domain-containing protein, partial [Cyanobacteria bacterium J06649_11]